MIKVTNIKYNQYSTQNTIYRRDVYMAKFEKSFCGNFKEVLDICEKSVIKNSVTSSLEESSNWSQGGTQVAIRVFERYSYTGSNRVALSVTLIGQGDNLFISAISAGGSQAILFKVNKWGENAFLNTLVSAIENYISNRG